MTMTMTAPTGINQQAFNDAINWCTKYTGSSNFIASIASQIKRGKQLSVKQCHSLMNTYLKSTAVSGSKVQLRTKTPDPNVITNGDEVAKWLENYNGTFTFLMDMKKNLLTGGGLTSAQWGGVIKCFSNDRSVSPASGQMMMYPAPIPVIINRTAAMKIKNQQNLAYGPFALEILGKGPAMGRSTLYRARINATGAVNVCRICGKSLVDHKSVVSGIGPVCAKNLGTIYHTYQTDIQKFMKEWADECTKVGEFDVILGPWHFKEGYTAISKATVVVAPVTNVPAPPPAPGPKIYASAHNISVGDIFDGKHLNLWLHPTTGHNLLLLNDKWSYIGANAQPRFDDDQDYTVDKIMDVTDSVGNIATVATFVGHADVRVAVKGLSTYVNEYCKGIRLHYDSNSTRKNDIVFSNYVGTNSVTSLIANANAFDSLKDIHAKPYIVPLISIHNYATGRSVSFVADLNDWYRQYPGCENAKRQFIVYKANVDGKNMILMITPINTK